MSEETRRLLEKEDTNPFAGKSDEYAYEISARELKACRANYGSLRATEELVPIKNQLTFAWCDINAFCQEPTGPKQNRLTSLLKTPETKQKQILKNVSGVAHPGELLVLMGSSGAGKTTLMNCMTFRNLKSLTITGLVCINGQSVNQTQLAAQSAYVQQDDLFIGFLTVKEHLIFQALVRMDSHYSYSERMERVEEVMIELSLKKCENVMIGVSGVVKGISGGERKRLALASELLTNPSLLFCDEPTSGLDSFMSLNVVQMLKTMAQTGRTVICTLHQPSSEIFQLFDKIGLMADGRTAFLGTPQEADKFFTKLQAPCPEDFNPADYYIQVLSIIPGREEPCREAVRCICDAFETSSVGLQVRKVAAATKASVIEDPWSNRHQNLSPYKVSWWSQFKAVTWRCWLSLKKNPRLTRMKVVQVIMISFLIDIAFWDQTYDQTGVQNINGAIFLFLTNGTFSDITGVIFTFCTQIPLFLREHKNGMYRTDVYFLSQVLVDLPIYTAFSILAALLRYYAIGLNPDFNRFLMCVLILIILSSTVVGVGYFISTVSSNIQMAQALMTAIITPAMIFGGFLLNLKSVPSYLQWIANLSWFKYTYQALEINQWSNINKLTCDSVYSFCPKDGLVVLESESISVSQFIPSIIALITLAIALRILSFLVLLYKAYFYE